MKLESINVMHGNINIFVNDENITKEKFLLKLAENIQNNKSIGYAGHKTKEDLIKTLERFIFNNNTKILRSLQLNKKEIINITSRALGLCNETLKNDLTYVFIFPTLNKFIMKNMNGVSGFCPFKNTILIFINPKYGWQKELEHSICHEYNHIIAYKYHDWKILLNSIIFEGLAEHFREYVVNGKKSPWAKAITKKECKKVFRKIKPSLYGADFKLYKNLFFGNEEFKQWSGYSLGYEIVKCFLSNSNIKDWNKIMKINPDKILKLSEF